MSGAAVLARLHDLGITVEPHGGRLALRPPSRVSPDLLAEVKAHRGEVLAEPGAGRGSLPPHRPGGHLRCVGAVAAQHPRGSGRTD